MILYICVLHEYILCEMGRLAVSRIISFRAITVSKIDDVCIYDCGGDLFNPILLCDIHLRRQHLEGY